MSGHQQIFRVLVVDDTTTIHEDFRKILTPASGVAPQVNELAAAIFGAASAAPAPVRFELDFATQGQAGLALVQDALQAGRPYALAFIDMRMPPGWDGLETITRLWSADPHLQTVICTAFSDHSWSAIGERLGPSDNLLILKKPFDRIEILQMSHALTRKWQLARTSSPAARPADPTPLYSAAFAASALPQAIVCLEKFQLVAANPAFERLAGIRHDPVSPPTWEQLLDGFAPDDRHDLLTRLSAGEILQNQPATYVLDPRRQRQLACSSHPLKVPGRRCAVWVWRDVTTDRSAHR